jgi:hypothetical protein
VTVSRASPDALPVIVSSQMNPYCRVNDPSVDILRNMRNTFKGQKISLGCG